MKERLDEADKRGLLHKVEPKDCKPKAAASTASVDESESQKRKGFSMGKGAMVVSGD